jgi:hypothetical protein
MMAELLASTAVLIVMGVVGGQIAGKVLRQARDELLIGIASGGVGGLGLGLLIGGFVGDNTLLFALLSDVALGLVGGALATAIVIPVRKGH